MHGPLKHIKNLQKTEQRNILKLWTIFAPKAQTSFQHIKPVLWLQTQNHLRQKIFSSDLFTQNVITKIHVQRKECGCKIELEYAHPMKWLGEKIANQTELHSKKGEEGENKNIRKLVCFDLRKTGSGVHLSQFRVFRRSDFRRLLICYGRPLILFITKFSVCSDFFGGWTVFSNNVPFTLNYLIDRSRLISIIQIFKNQVSRL